MASETSVVTLERYSGGFTYKEYLDQIKVNKDWFERLYDNFQLQPEDSQFFRDAAQNPAGPARLMVIGEDWCPDVYRGMPVMAKIAEAAGIEMRVFPRDDNLDIMNEFLKEGQFLSIPTAVFYTRDHQYICHWIERPARATRDMAEILEQAKREMPDSPEAEQRAVARPRNQARFPDWQQESVREIRAMLTERMGL